MHIAITKIYLIVELIILCFQKYSMNSYEFRILHIILLDLVDIIMVKISSNNPSVLKYK